MDYTLERKSINRLNEETTRRKLRHAIKPVKNLVSLSTNLDVIPGNGGYLSRIKIRVKGDEDNVLRRLIPRTTKLGWLLSDGNAPPPLEINIKPTDIAAVISKPPFVVPDLTPKIIEDFFGHIYERDAHIRLIHDSVKSFIASDRKIRSHVLLYGEPSAAKSTLFNSFKKWFDSLDGESFNRVVKIDGHTTSKAGLENMLIDLAQQGNAPDILFIEEIEKRDKLNDLDVLISIMQDGYLTKLNARVSHRVDTPFLVWATCNDEELLRRVRNGAIWSRFGHTWRVFRPSKDSMRKILEDKIVHSGGNPIWIDKIIELCYDKLNITDPRKIISCMDGRDRLLDGSYQEDLIKIIGASSKIEKIEE